MASIPRPAPEDPSAVRHALSEVARLWQEGRRSEALRLLRKAAGVAADLGLNERAGQLFEQVVELARGRSSRPGGSAPEEEPAGLADDELPTTRFVPAEDATPSSVFKKATNELPRTKLRKAMAAIDPEYTDRVDYRPDAPPPLPPVARAASAMSPNIGYLDATPSELALERPSMDYGESWLTEAFEEAAEAAEGSRDAPSSEPAASSSLALAGALPSYPVNLVFLRDEGEISVLFVPPGTHPREGVAAALLIPESAEDARLLAKIYERCDAKL